MISQAGKRMLSYLPKLYETSRVMQSKLDAEGQEIDALRQALDEVLAQTFVQTATWGLDRWEEELGLPPGTGLPDQERRERILSKLRGYGTVTIDVVKAVAESYERGRVEVIPDPPSYTVTIKFVDTRGVPSALPLLQEALRAVIPAHLDIRYEFTYYLVREIAEMTVAEAAQKTVAGLLSDE